MSNSRTHMLRVDLCMDCTLYLSEDAIPPSRPNLPELVTRRFPEHVVVATPDDPDPFSTLPCSCCFSPAYGARQKHAYWRRPSPVPAP